jgi:hypothetical protein
MRFSDILAFIVVLMLCPGWAQAESPYQGGMKYTAVRKHPAPPAPAAAPADGANASSSIHFKEIAPKPEAAQPAEETPASRVWKKYKSLAAGTYEEPIPAAKQNTAGESETSPAPQPPQTAANAAPPPAKNTGMAAIIDEYRRNKSSQSQMRTLRFQQPETQAASPAN